MHYKKIIKIVKEEIKDNFENANLPYDEYFKKPLYIIKNHLSLIPGTAKIPNSFDLILSHSDTETLLDELLEDIFYEEYYCSREELDAICEHKIPDIVWIIFYHTIVTVKRFNGKYFSCNLC